MFDPQSTALLQSAPSIPGISPEDLPRLLTDTYTELVINRLKNVDNNQINSSVSRLMEIATSYELIVTAQGDFANRRAAAFVAGSAYQILSKSLIAGESKTEAPFSRDHIDGRIAASLLFLIAEQYPDAKEAIANLGVIDSIMSPQLQILLQSIQYIIKENYLKVLDNAAERVQFVQDNGGDKQTLATVRLYDLILQGLELMASRIMGSELPVTVKQEYSTPLQIFQTVISLATQKFVDTPFRGGFTSTYPGPAHLASLLSSAAESLEAASILNLIPPDGVNEGMWYTWLRYRAETKPILWPNHKEAFDRRFHYPGISCVMVLPTGSGKTTLSEYKIAATLAKGKKVIFLAPTNALVEQLKGDLAKHIPTNIFGHDWFSEIDLFTTADDSLSQLEVMTPEKCLAILNFNPVIFEDVGLLVFDECHSLSSDSGSLRRSIDGMLVILNLQHYVKGLDFLFLSAMLKNGDDFAEWIEHLTGRRCISVNTVWKPSRQARGILIYPERELNNVTVSATVAQRAHDDNRRNQNKQVSKEPVTAATKQLLLTPHALFGLINNWHPDTPEDISLKRLSDLPYKLNGQFGPGRSIEVTPTGNEVARNLAVSCVQAGLKTIVFTNNANWTWSSAKKVRDLIGEDGGYTRHENFLWNAIVAEFGNPECSMLYNMKSVVLHNANLINYERQLAESLFKRPNGAKVIFATTTLSQGMNLPAQVAILSADERALLEGNKVTQEPLKAHELLNAAGRAGRAGYLANGMVLLIPRTLLTFNEDRPQKAAESILRSIIPEDEQCVSISDPLQVILDQIQIESGHSVDVDYIIHRLSDGEEGVNLTFNRSFASYQAYKKNIGGQFELDVQKFKKLINSRSSQVHWPDWISKISIQSGISPSILNDLYESIKPLFDKLPTNILEWTTWLISWLGRHFPAGQYCFGNDLIPLRTITGRHIDEENYGQSLDVLLAGIIPWLSGQTISEIEIRMGGKVNGQGIICNKAREVVTNIAPRALSFFSSLFVQIVKQVAEELNYHIPYLSALECMPAAISKGFDMSEKLAYYQLSKELYLHRVLAHRNFNERYNGLQSREGDDFKMVLNRMREIVS